eukprot:TRINITY_DN27945_c0_g1_i16.p1 TRINITY_DN27945_c0_g1~~TRINITY_DN27945_c0_g1_i16.p1  ORF type:complete len:471 (+),score=48.06 TRINITY_DN27945_c0_g1_i16:188-1600(+)
MSQFVLKQFRPTQDKPAELNPEIFGPGLEVNNSRLQVTFVREGNHENDVGSIQADKPVPTLCRVYYFEMLIKNKGERGKFVIGFTDKRFNHGRMPGWDVGGFGYCGQDGTKLIGQMQGQQYGPAYSQGDTVGAGIHMQKKEIFFTKNNQYLGVACSIDLTMISELTPTIGLHSKNESVEVNFGAKPFKFDLEGMVEEVCQDEKKQYQNKQSSTRSMHAMVSDYLLFHGYRNTLEKFEGAQGTQAKSMVSAIRQGWQRSLFLRSQVRRLILNDNVEAVVNLLNQQSDLELTQEGYSDVEFMLHVQKFLEICMRQCKNDNGKSALKYAQSFLTKFQQMQDFPVQRRKLLEDCMTLLMYYPVLPDWLSYLVSTNQKDAIADAVNLALVALENKSQSRNHLSPQLQTALERLLQYLVVVHAKMFQSNGSQGEVFLLNDFMDRYCSEIAWDQEQTRKGNDPTANLKVVTMDSKEF